MNSNLARRSLAFASLAPLLVAVLGACGGAPEPSSESAASEESAALKNCSLNPDLCGGGTTDPCQAICDGTTCKSIRAGTKTCACMGPCSGGATCSAGHCVAPPPPTCTGAPPAYQTWWVPGAQEILFHQLEPNEFPNTNTQCKSGCGPTAWAMFFAQMDTKWRSFGIPNWNADPSWFQAVQPDARSVSWGGNYAQITMDINHHLGTSCAPDPSVKAFTEPSWMASVEDYITQGPEMAYWPYGPLIPYTTPGFAYQYDTHDTDDSLAPDYDNVYGTLDYARDWIANYGYPVVYGYYTQPAHAHYGLATGYRQKATAWNCEEIGGAYQWVITSSDDTQWQFYINGGGGDSDDWRSPAAYYVGTVKIFRQ